MSMIKGDMAPDFEVLSHNGTKVRLSNSLVGGPVVLFFYPRAMTRGCTPENCHFRDLAAEFAALHATRLGISTDSVERQSDFADKEKLDFPLLSDPDRSIARAFAVKRPGPLFNRRQTFVIGTDRVVLAVISSETNMNRHADEALAALTSKVVTASIYQRPSQRRNAKVVNHPSRSTSSTFFMSIARPAGERRRR